MSSLARKHSRLLLLLVAHCGAIGYSGFALAAQPQGSIVLIGGAASHSVGEHDFPRGIRALEQLLRGSPDVARLGLPIEAFPDSWPGDAAALDRAATLVWYFDGLDRHPMLDAGRRAHVERLLRKGVGLVALHQASTLPAENKSVDLVNWLGAARYGMFDRTTEVVNFAPAAHAVSQGVGAFTLHDEFYPTLRFAARNVTPVLIGKFHVQVERDRPIVTRTSETPAAWAFERDGGGRSFGFTGLHYAATLDQPEMRKLLLNAIVWTAHAQPPKDGVRSESLNLSAQVAALIEQAERPAVREAIVSRPSDYQVAPQPWGQLTWYASRQLQNSTTMTVGQAVIRPGQKNPRHYHPNCDEVLHVISGRILHSMADKTVEMQAGDTVSIPQGVKHNATNIGTDDAVLSISFSSADRQVIGE